MKRRIAATVVAVLIGITGLSACGGHDKSSGSSTAKPPAVAAKRLTAGSSTDAGAAQNELVKAEANGQKDADKVAREAAAKPTALERMNVVVRAYCELPVDSTPTQDVTADRLANVVWQKVWEPGKWDASLLNAIRQPGGCINKNGVHKNIP